MRRISSRTLLVVGVWLIACIALLGVALRVHSSAPSLALVAVFGSCTLGLRAGGLTFARLRDAARALSGLEAAAVGIVLIALAAAVVRLPATLRAGYDDLDAPVHSLQLADVEPLSLDAPIQALIAARRAIPSDASYTVLSGTGYKVPYIFNFWLLPREFTWSVTQASWVIAFVQPPPAGLRYARRVLLAPNIYALEVER